MMSACGLRLVGRLPYADVTGLGITDGLAHLLEPPQRALAAAGSSRAARNPALPLGAAQFEPELLPIGPSRRVHGRRMRQGVGQPWSLGRTDARKAPRTPGHSPQPDDWVEMDVMALQMLLQAEE